MKVILNICAVVFLFGIFGLGIATGGWIEQRTAKTIPKQPVQMEMTIHVVVDGQDIGTQKQLIEREY